VGRGCGCCITLGLRVLLCLERLVTCLLASLGWTQRAAIDGRVLRTADGKEMRWAGACGRCIILGLHCDY
jgi:hypothetical protein